MQYNTVQLVTDQGEILNICVTEQNGYRYVFRTRSDGWDIIGYYQDESGWRYIPAEIDKEEVRIALIDFRGDLNFVINKHLDDLTEEEWIYLILRMDDKIGFLVGYLEYWREMDEPSVKEWLA